MHPYTATVRIAATPDRIWPMLADVQSWPRWLPTMTSVERLGDGKLTIGARYKIEQPRFRPTVWTVVSLEPPHSFAWEARWPGARALATHSLSLMPGGSSDLVLTVVFSGPLSLLARGIAGGTVARYLSREAASLKQQVEGKL